MRFRGGGREPGSTGFCRGLPHGLALFLGFSEELLSVSVLFCSEGCCEAKDSKADTIHSIRLVFLRIFDCFISLKKEKVAFFILAVGSSVGKSCFVRWSLWRLSSWSNLARHSSLGVR